ncbi:MAG TPA: divergent polysaccharide deacetylase family protein, partial [Acetobacteraceae bacterium]|nr:divergent polysaccharide deacetylase family protein [Acetobacteraceae bacterium]
TRAAGHEFLISLPMEPQGYPLNDAGDHALLTAVTPELNRSRLDWALSRITGYVGATGALGLLRGERFAGSPQMAPVLADLNDRGLLYVDGRPGRPPVPSAWSRGVDLVIDEPAVRTEIEAKLAALEQIARDKGSALGLAGATRPITVDRLAAWTNGLAARGFALAPVSAIVVAPRPAVPDARDVGAKDLATKGSADDRAR